MGSLPPTKRPMKPGSRRRAVSDGCYSSTIDFHLSGLAQNPNSFHPNFAAGNNPNHAYHSKNMRTHQYSGTANARSHRRRPPARLKQLCSLSNSRSGLENTMAPLTSFDWTPVNRNKIAVAAIDSTITLWDIQKQTVDSQLIAHDKAIYDVAFSSQDETMFSSVGEDGSMRVFDVRNMMSSTILYESEEPLMRLAWNKKDPQYNCGSRR